MAEDDKFFYIALGLLVGVPAGAVLLWFFTHPRTSVSYVPVKTYSNLEEWEIIRDPETGRTKGVRVHRKAREE